MQFTEHEFIVVSIIITIKQGHENLKIKLVHNDYHNNYNIDENIRN